MHEEARIGRRPHIIPDLMCLRKPSRLNYRPASVRHWEAENPQDIHSSVNQHYAKLKEEMEAGFEKLGEERGEKKEKEGGKEEPKEFRMTCRENSFPG